jgi:alanine dehydrogenase
VRPIQEVRIYSPRTESREKFAAVAREKFGARGVRVSCCDAIEAACAGADVVTLVTRATQAFLSAGMLQAGTHVNAVGAIAPDREEFEQDVFDRSGSVVVDDLTSVKNLSREFRTRYQEDWTGVATLAELISQGRRRAADADLTLFKAMGMGLSDVALGVEVLARAHAAKVGRVIDAPVKATPRFFDTAVAA